MAAPMCSASLSVIMVTDSFNTGEILPERRFLDGFEVHNGGQLALPGLEGGAFTGDRRRGRDVPDRGLSLAAGAIKAKCWRRRAARRSCRRGRCTAGRQSDRLLSDDAPLGSTIQVDEVGERVIQLRVEPGHVIAGPLQGRGKISICHAIWQHPMTRLAPATSRRSKPSTSTLIKVTASRSIPSPATQWSSVVQGTSTWRRPIFSARIRRGSVRTSRSAEADHADAIADGCLVRQHEPWRPLSITLRARHA